MIDRTGSPASFLTCSSGWDPGIICGAVKFPSLLHSRQSVEDLNPAQETHHVPSEFNAWAEYSRLGTKSSQVPQSPSKVSPSVATPFYLSPTLRCGDFGGLQSSDFVPHTPPRTTLTPRLTSPTNNEYWTPSPQTTSPGSDFSLEESTTSSIYHSPFHWDTVLAGLPPSPRRSPLLPTTTIERLPVKLSTPTAPVPPFAQWHETATRSPQRDSVSSTAIPDIIPTIVVRGPDSDTVPTPASVSSIIGLYGGLCESTQVSAREAPILELQVSKEAPELDSDSDGTCEGGSSPESDFEIVTAPALKVRLDDILETDRMDVENAFGSLMVRYPSLTLLPFVLIVYTQTLGSLASANSRNLVAEGTSAELPANGRDFPSFSTATSVLSSGQIVRGNPKVSTSTSFASTAKLYYAQSGTSISGQSTASSWDPTASESETDFPWLFCVENGKILELPRSTSVHGRGKFADKLARFPNVPKSPQLTPLPSPFASPLPSPSPANLRFPDWSLLPPDILKKKLGGPATLDGVDTGPLLSPRWERSAVECTTALPPVTSTSCQPTSIPEPSKIEEISFGELDVNPRLPIGSGPLAPTSLPTDSSSSSGYSTKLSIAQSATLSYSRHVHFESADFKTSSTVVGPKRHSPHHRRPPLVRSKTCLKKKRWSEKVQDRRDSSDASTALVRSPGIDCDHLPSSFSSGSLSKKGSWWRRGRLLVVIGRVRKGIGGCLPSREEDAIGGSTVWATEHDYWNEHLVKGESQRHGDPRQGDDGAELLRRISRYS